jgi:Tol biopolymer transport system component
VAATPFKAVRVSRLWSAGSGGRSAAAGCVLAAVLAGGAVGASDPRPYTAVSVNSSGVFGDGHSERPTISGDGRFVAFASQARNLVPGDANGYNVLVRDTATKTTTRVSVNSAGVQIDQQPFFPVISANGRFVAFETDAGNVVPSDGFRDSDVFVHDRATRTTTAASVNSSGQLGIYPHPDVGSNYPALSADGRFVAFDSTATNFDASAERGVFVHDRVTGQTTRVSVSSAGVPGNNAEGLTGDPAISADGRFVAFWSGSTNLVPGDTNRQADVFVRDRATATTTRVSVSSSDAEANGSSRLAAISADGRFVGFDSFASNLVPSDTNQVNDVFLRDRATGTTTRLSVDRDGGQQPAISADGRFVAFVAVVPRPWTPLFLYDRGTGKTAIVSPEGLGTPSLDRDGHFVAFGTGWPHDPGDRNEKGDIYVRDTTVALPEPTTRRVVRITVAIKKRNGKIHVRGTVRPRLPRRTLAVMLSRWRSTRYVNVRTKSVRLTRASAYSAAFRRPRAFFCRVRASFSGDSRYAPATSGVKFRC